jgi:hypothetical protein
MADELADRLSALCADRLSALCEEWEAAMVRARMRADSRGGKWTDADNVTAVVLEAVIPEFRLLLDEQAPKGA